MNDDSDCLKQLNPEQRKAVVHKDGPLLILAGAGSGKTSTMTHRIAYLIRQQGVSPHEILAVTFTNKAAGEMRERVEALIGDTQGMWILTFHSACLRILRMYADRLGYGRDFVVYDPADQKTVIKNCMKEKGINDKKYQPAYFLSIISDCKEKGKSPAEFAEESNAGPRDKMAADIYSAYEKVLKANKAMDFDDLLLQTVRLFQQEKDVLQRFRQRFRYIMADEYQDTNYMQYRFLRMLAEGHNNICVVGDDDQCIYQWRGADINNILDFEKDFKGTKVIKLERNYRSDGNILAAAHAVIKNNFGRKPKKLWTDKAEGEKVRYFRAEDDKDEARYIAAQVDRLCNGSRQYSDFAVLYRTNVQSRQFEDPDRLVDDDGLVEIKVPNAGTHIGYLINDSIDPIYKPQVQGQLLLSGRQWCDWVSYHDFIRPIIIRTYRDDEYIQKLQDAIDEFCLEYLNAIRKLIDRGIVEEHVLSKFA